MSRLNPEQIEALVVAFQEAYLDAVERHQGRELVATERAQVRRYGQTQMEMLAGAARVRDAQEILDHIVLVSEAYTALVPKARLIAG